MIWFTTISAVCKIMGGNYGLKLDFDFWCHSGDKSISRKVQHAKTPLIFDKIELMTTTQFHHHSNLAHLLSQYLGKSLCNTSKTFMTLEPFYTQLLNQTLYIHSEQATVFANSFQ